jgi:hypothetical protein
MIMSAHAGGCSVCNVTVVTAGLNHPHHTTHREAKKMNQPGDLRNLQKAGASRFKDMASDSPALQVMIGGGGCGGAS